jgi:hypothetical protein
MRVFAGVHVAGPLRAGQRPDVMVHVAAVAVRRAGIAVERVEPVLRQRAPRCAGARIAALVDLVE